MDNRPIELGPFFKVSPSLAQIYRKEEGIGMQSVKMYIPAPYFNGGMLGSVGQ